MPEPNHFLTRPDLKRDFYRQLRRWFAREGRDLPWRRTRDPYAILVSEVMLQQTQVATVLPFYDRWLARFPDLSSLARATESEVLHGWQGLGYYARARNLHAAVRMVLSQFGGELPRGLQKIRALPGIGRYTAGAVACFAFDQPVAVVETNIARLLSRLTNLQEPVDSSAGRTALWETAAALLPKKRVREYNYALMDFGALTCTARQPQCNVCVVRKYCRAEDPISLPRKQPNPRSVQLTERHALILRPGHVLLEQSHQRWRGFWILPRLVSGPRGQALLESTFPFTNHRITLEVFPGRQIRAKENQKWVSLRNLTEIPMPSPHRRALQQLLGQSQIAA